VTFLERLQSEVLIGDGAIGTMLYARGVGLDANFEHLNLVRPSLVGDLHREYLAAGARLLETNTFGANLTKLAPIGLEKKLREINRQGALLARQAVADAGLPAGSVCLAGSVGPLARLRGEERELSPADMTAIYREQVTALAEGGVDLFALETFADLDQLLCALAAVQETGLPAIASMAYLEGARTAAGVAAAAAARALTAAGAAVIGANCGAGPLEVLHTLQQLAGTTSLPLAAFANSGFPEYVDGRHIYRTTPDYFADRGAEMVAAGAVVVGGCCGTTPAHIRALAQRLQGLKPVTRTIAVTVAAPAEAPPARPAAGGFLAGWGRKPVVTVELDPPKGLDCRKVLAGARALKEAGADAINLAENPLARVRMGNIALARLIQDEVGIEVIVHVTCRDRNLLGLQSDLMGASLLGIRAILAVTGDPARLGDQAGASSVFDLNSFGLIKLLSDLNAGVNALGHPIGGGTGFTIGGALNPNSPRPELQVARLAKKVAAGASFAQTQPVFGVEPLRTVLALAAPLGIPVLPGIMPLVSERNCEYLHNEVPGITIPDEIRARMRGKEKDAGVREGLLIAGELVTALKGEVGGFYLIAPFGRHEIVAELVREIKG
jgi:methionine synthase / methylenetetrahydrofolate reductase (NADH)